MKHLNWILAGIVALSSCASPWTGREKSLICAPESTMRVLTLDSREDSLVLRQTCTDLPAEAIQSSIYGTLAAKMIATVTDPSQDGVGIAGPQVGILRRVVAVQRFDKEGEPFEVYPNIRITALAAKSSPARKDASASRMHL